MPYAENPSYLVGIILNAQINVSKKLTALTVPQTKPSALFCANSFTIGLLYLYILHSFLSYQIFLQQIAKLITCFQFQKFPVWTWEDPVPAVSYTVSQVWSAGHPSSEPAQLQGLWSSLVGLWLLPNPRTIKWSSIGQKSSKLSWFHKQQTHTEEQLFSRESAFASPGVNQHVFHCQRPPRWVFIFVFRNSWRLWTTHFCCGAHPAGRDGC